MLAAFALAACGPASATRAAPSSSSRPAASTAAPTYAVTTRSVSGLGTILVDGKGRTLYLFAPDHDSGRSRCYSLCANQWPPLVLPKGVTTPIALGGAKTPLLGTTRRRNGSLQVTYAGWPLYWFIYDAKPGDATGEGLDSLGGLWYVVDPAGNRIRDVRRTQ